MAIYNEKVKELRIAAGMTLKEVAEKLGVTEATAQRYETGNGIKSIPYNKIIKYSEIFDVIPEYIMGWDSKKPYAAPDKLAEITTEPELVDYAWKILQLDETQRNIVYGMIDQMTQRRC